MYGTVFPYSRTSNHLGMRRRDYHTAFGGIVYTYRWIYRVYIP